MHNNKKTVLILYTSVGLGHKFIAENIAWHLQQAEFDVKLFDVLKLQAGWLVNFGIWLHSLINRKFPWFWNWLYTSKLVTDLTLSSRVRVAAKNCDHIKAVINEYQPDVIITTQTSASAPIQYLIESGFYKGKFVIAFSDYHLHRHWLYESTDLYLVNTPEQKNEMVNLGFDDKKIVVCGVTLKPVVDFKIQKIKEKLSVPLDHRLIIVASGSLGIGGISIPDIIKLVAMGSSNDIDIVIVCGKNSDLENHLKILEKDYSNLHVYGFYSPMQELFYAADLILSKPGGLTVAETLQYNLPMIVTHWLPGQELINYRYLVEKGLVIPKPKNFSVTSLFTIINRELNDKKFKNSLENNSYHSLITQKGQEGEVLVKAIKLLVS